MIRSSPPWPRDSSRPTPDPHAGVEGVAKPYPSATGEATAFPPPPRPGLPETRDVRAGGEGPAGTGMDVTPLICRGPPCQEAPSYGHRNPCHSQPGTANHLHTRRESSEAL